MNAPCHEIRELFDLFLDGGILRKEKARLKAHLKECPACRALLEEEREVINMFADLPELPCSEKVVQRIEELTVGHKIKSSLLEKILLQRDPFHWRLVSVSLAASAIIFLFVLHPYLNRKESVQVQYTQEEVLKARDQAKWSLAYMANMVSKTEREVVENVLLKDLPKTVRKSIKNAVPIFRGGQK